MRIHRAVVRADRWASIIIYFIQVRIEVVSEDLGRAVGEGAIRVSKSRLR